MPFEVQNVEKELTSLLSWYFSSSFYFGRSEPSYLSSCLVGYQQLELLLACLNMPLTMVCTEISRFPITLADILQAPIVWLHKDESYLPSDIYNQVENTLPSINLTSIIDPPNPLTLENLDSLNKYGRNGSNVYLTSIVDVTTAPKWLNGVAPDFYGKTNGATSSAIIVNDHGAGLVDVFYMYFYAYNQGNIVFGRELGDHIGDWEHNMIRFQDGQPTAIWYSQHGNGQAFTYRAVEKDTLQNLRPISYSAIGSHANYGTAGTHDHAIPNLNLPAGFLQDYTSKGTKWDPTLAAYFYTYKNGTFGSIDGSPVGAMYYRGQWGDQQYPDSDPRQPAPFFGFRKFVGGPRGPRDKQLQREKICPDNGILCILRDRLGP